MKTMTLWGKENLKNNYKYLREGERSLKEEIHIHRYKHIFFKKTKEKAVARARQGQGFESNLLGEHLRICRNSSDIFMFASVAYLEGTCYFYTFAPPNAH